VTTATNVKTLKLCSKVSKNRVKKRILVVSDIKCVLRFMTVILTIVTSSSSKIVFYNHVTTASTVKTVKMCSKVAKIRV